MEGNAEAVAGTKDRTGPAAVVLAVLWVLAYFGARAAIELLEPGSALRLAAVLAPVPPFAGMLYYLIKGVRGADELERRIHLEALAVAFPLTMLMLMVLGLLELAIDLNPADWSYRHVWPFMAMFWYAGLALARRRYA